MSGAPLYRQVKTRIREGIEAGQLLPGGRVPSESEICRDFGVSRMTANRALRELTSEGLLVRRQGGGTFVADHTARSDLLVLRNIADEVAARGHRHSAQVRHLASEAPDAPTARDLELAAGDCAFHSVILHFEEGRPIQLEDRWVNPAAAPDYLQCDFSRITPNAYLMKVAPLAEAEHVVEAVIPDGNIRALLQMAAHEPALRVIRRTWSQGRIASLAVLWHPGARYSLGARVAPTP